MHRRALPPRFHSPVCSSFRSSVFRSSVALAAVGAAFVLKYGAEVSPLAGVAALAFGTAYVAAVWAARRVEAEAAARGALVLEVLLVGGALALALVSPLENEVARLPALDVWLDRIAAGAYPYGSPVRPSGFPGLFLAALPFWALGLLRLLPVVGLVVFLALLRRAEVGRRLAVLVGLALLPPVYYEVVVHSELFLNSTLALGSLVVVERARRRGEALLLVGVLAGLVLSTRLYVGVVYAVYGAYAFRPAWARGAAFAGVALAVWAATWLPFWAWDPQRFGTFGPFAVQTLYLPGGVAALTVPAALALGWWARDLAAVIARTGWLLFGLVAFAGIVSVDRALPLAAFAGFDVAYLIVPVPFLLLSLSRRPRSASVRRSTLVARPSR